MAVLRVDQHAGGRGGATVAIQDADFVIRQLEVGDLRIHGGERLAQGFVERVDRPIAFSGGVEDLALNPQLDRCLNLWAIRAVLDDQSGEVQQLKRRNIAFSGPVQHERHGGLRPLKDIPFVLQALDFLQDGVSLLR